MTSSNGGHFWRYSRGFKGVLEERRSPGATAYEQHLYTLTHNGFGVDPAADPDEVEDELSRIEAEAAPVRLTLTGRGAQHLTQTQRDAWATFVTSLEMRHPDTIRLLEKGSRARNRQLLRNARKRMRGGKLRKLFTEKFPDEEWTRMSDDHIRKTVPRMTRTHPATQRIAAIPWEIIKLNCPGHPEFVATDKPIVFVGPSVKTDRFAQFVMAISPWHLFGVGTHSLDAADKTRLWWEYNAMALARSPEWVLCRTRQESGALRTAIDQVMSCPRRPGL